MIGRLVGWHGFDLLPEADGCRVTHTLELATSLTSHFQWIAIAPIHDWAVEAMFDRLEHALRTGVVPARTERPMSRVVAFSLGLALSDMSFLQRVARRLGKRPLPEIRRRTHL